MIVYKQFVTSTLEAEEQVRMNCFERKQRNVFLEIIVNHHVCLPFTDESQTNMRKLIL